MSDLVVVTGPTGNVGAEVVRSLAPRHTRVRIAARNPSAAGAAAGLDVEAVPFTFENDATHAAAVRGARALFLMRPRTIADVERYVNPLVDAAVRAGVERIVFLSVAPAAHDPRVPHRRVEQHIEAAGVAWTFLRANFFMQNLSTVHRADIRDRQDVFVPAGDGQIAYVDVRDLGAVAASALTEPGHAGQAYELSGPRAWDHTQVAELLTHVLGRRITYSTPASADFVEELVRRGLPAAEAAFIDQVYRVVREGQTATVTGDVQAALGRPPTSLEQFARDYADCWRQAEPDVPSS